jgi:hypothetical protein
LEFFYEYFLVQGKEREQVEGEMLERLLRE